MTGIIFVVALIVFVRGVSTLMFLNQSLSWLRKNNRKTFRKKSNKPEIYIIITLLREQQKIIATLNYFVKNFKEANTHLIIVTSEREYEKELVGPSTQQVVKNYISKNKQSRFISIINYPNKNGFKAHQVNYALDTIKDVNSYITIYDADSRPHPDTLNRVREQLRVDSGTKVLLQSAIFLNNYHSCSSVWAINEYFLKASAILQTRWTLTHELPRLLRQSDSSIWLFKKYVYAHIVGHGMFIETKLFKMLGGFPTETVTEDLFLGYLLRCRGVAIYPLSILELSDSPKKITSLWKQKYVWFWGPMKTFSYLRYVFKNKEKLGNIDLSIPLALTVQNLVSSLAWLLSSPMVALLLISPFLNLNMPLIVFAYVSVIIYGPVQYLIIANNFLQIHRFSGSRQDALAINDRIWLVLMSIPAILFNSIPPYFSLFTEMRSSINKQAIYKPKTDD